MIRVRLIAAASISAFSIFSFIVGPQWQAALLGNRDPVLGAVAADKNLDQVRDRAVVLDGGHPQRLLEGWIDAKVEGPALQAGPGITS